MIRKLNFSHINLFMIVSLFVFLSAAIALLPLSNARALSGSEFNASRIISDGVFFNSTTMGANEIQAFLNAKLPVCDTYGTQLRGSVTRAAYGTSLGVPPPYTCLKDFSQTIPSKSPDAYCTGSIWGATKSAAQIIADVSQACGINPQVLIDMLQKEQSLVTDDWPWPIQYRSATGYGCPDTAACDSQYYGFFNQVYNAARQIKRYVALPNSFNFASGRTSLVSYQANRPDCGGSYLTLQNSATAALYNYTPYQPNAAALANLYGTGDACSAYGNRNFWRLFRDWFGSTEGTPAQYAGQSANPWLREGQSTNMYVQYRNTGVTNWYDDVTAAANNSYPLHLAITNPINSESPFSWGWSSKGRPAVNFGAVYEADGVTLAGNQHLVMPNQIVRFNFTITVPYGFPPGQHRIYVQPVLEGSNNWNIGGVAWIDTNVIETNQAAQYAGQSANPTLAPGQSTVSYFQYRNVGNTNWYDDVTAAANNVQPVHLATSGPVNRASSFSWGWPNSARPAVNFSAVYEADGVTLAGNQHLVLPNQIARFSFNTTVPYNYPDGNYTEYVQPVWEGSNRWNMGGVAWSVVGVQSPTYQAQYVGQSSYPWLRRGESTNSYIRYKNIGTAPWYDTTTAAPNNTNPINLAITNPINSKSSFGWGWNDLSRPAITFGAVYESDGTTLASNQHKVDPGQIVQYNFPITVPYGYPYGRFSLYFQPIREGASSWNMGGMAWTDVSVY